MKDVLLEIVIGGLSALSLGVSLLASEAVNNNAQLRFHSPTDLIPNQSVIYISAYQAPEDLDLPNRREPGGTR